MQKEKTKGIKEKKKWIHSQAQISVVLCLCVTARA